MKRLLFLLVAGVVGASTFDYSRGIGHYGVIVILGVIATLLLVGKAVE
ncbi:hypothetical protein [Nocardia yunnanensis]|nr:hypothetical protein [Nocardia yunnanensis]